MGGVVRLSSAPFRKFWTRNKAGDTLEDFFFIVANPYEHLTQPRNQPLPSTPASVQQQQAASDKPAWNASGASNMDTSSSSTPSTSTATATISKPPLRPTPAIIPGMGLEGDLFEKLREQQYSGSSGSTQALPSLLQESGGIPGLGGLPDTGDTGTGGRKTLLKQPPPKKAQRQFERVWNVNSRLQGAMLGPADDGGPPGDTTDYRKPKPSLLGAPPPPVPMDVGPSQPTPLLGPGPTGGVGSGSSTHGIPSLLATPAQPPPSLGGAWLDQGGPSGGDMWQQQSQQTGGSFLGGSQYPNQRHGGGSGSSNFLLPTPDTMDTGRGGGGGGGGQWLRGGGASEDSGHGDIDLRQMGSSVTGGAGAWGGNTGAYEDVDYRDMASSGTSSGAGMHSRPSNNPRDPRMQPRSQPQQQSQQQPEPQQTDYRFQNWLDPGSSSHQSSSSSQSILDRRAPQQSPSTAQQPKLSSDPRRQAQPQQQQPQSLLSLNLQAPPSNGSGFGGGQMMGAVSSSRSRSDDQDSDQELYGSGGGGGRNAGGGAPTNPKRKWKQEYEAEEAQGGTKRWALSTDEDSPPASFPMSGGSGDRDERHLWGRPSSGGGGGNGRR